jgi:hypothetical protein
MSPHSLTDALRKALLAAPILVGILISSSAHGLVINVKTEGPNGTLVPIPTGFRYLIEEDNTHHAVPGIATPIAPWPDPSNTLAVDIHRSHAPVVCSGDTQTLTGATTIQWTASADTASNPDCTLNPTKYYMVSVMPWHVNPLFYPASQPNGPWFANQAGYGLNGRNVAPGQTSVDVVVHKFAVPTAQITALVFLDNQPINGAQDQPAEPGLGGFNLLLKDPVSKVMQDAWGNELGTTYKVQREAAPNCTGAHGFCKPLKNADGTYQFIVDPATSVPLVDYAGNGTLTTCPSGNPGYDAANCTDLDTGAPLAAGEAVVRFLAPNRYSLEPVPPANDPDWILTATLEGTRANDMWVRAAEPRFNDVVGQINHLVFFGVVKNMPMTLPSPSGKRGEIKGQIVYAHDTHPPYSPGLSASTSVPNCFVGLNNLGGNDEQVYTSPCKPDGTFDIKNVPPGLYQLAAWDKEINAIVDYRNVTVPAAGGTVDLGQVAIYRWFGILKGSTFYDANANGYPEPGEAGIPQQRVNVRYSDGSLYATQLTDFGGNYLFDQMFPFWRFMVVEIESARFKSTGVTSIIDDGGIVPPGPYASWGVNPQIQPDTGLPYRTQRSAPGDEVRTQAMALYQDMTNIIDWGRGNYSPTDNGGIHGFISYATSRTQEGPERAAWQSWEPGVPRVQVNLYNATQDSGGNWVRATCSGGTCTPCTGATCAPINSTFSDSWDDSNPTGCVGQPGSLSANPQVVNGIPIRNCAETFRTWNQVRPGVFDGAYAFSSYCQGTLSTRYPDVTCNGTLIPTLPQGNYVVELVPPTGYKVLGWGDRNIEFGEPDAAVQMYQAQCVGPKYAVPQFHQLFPDWQIPTQYPALNQWYCTGTVDAYGYCTPASAGPMAASCSEKLMNVAQGKDSIVDFRVFTDVPKASRIWGTVWDDMHLESNLSSPNASGNYTPSWLPVSIKDYTGTEVARFYTDQWGHFDGLIPSTYTIFTPNPLGMSAGIYRVLPNDPGPILDTNPLSATHGQYITDPWFNPGYSQGEPGIRENWDFYAGTTTFIDTIVLPIAGFSQNAVHLNCDFVDATPEVAWANFNGQGPLVPRGGGSRITIQAVGQIQVPNPDFNPNLPPTTTGCSSTPAPAGNNCASIVRDHGFGPADGHGLVTVGGVALTNLTWSNNTIQATVPANVTTGQLTVTRTNPNNAGYPLSSTVGITLHVDDPAIPVIHVTPAPANCDPYADATRCTRIQPAIDSAPNGALIIIAQGHYPENVIMYKPVKLQGWGATSTVIDGVAAVSNLPMAANWNTLFTNLQNNTGGCTTSPCIDTPPGNLTDWVFEQGAGIMVAACDPTAHGGHCANQFTAATAPLIDGLAMTGAAEAGGGIMVNSYAPNLQISNTEVIGNQGSLSGGIRVGTSTLTNGTSFTSSHNENIQITHNRISQNGSLVSGAGGVALYKGSDNYRVTSNLICGNYSFGYGGGIEHFGLSPGGVISQNVIVSNESSDEGGGIMIAGELVPAGSPAGTLTEGAGSVTVNDNLIQGNKGGDDGGGIRTLLFNGQDVSSNKTNSRKWFRLNIFNNMIVNNSSADHGGGISLDDTVLANITHNTIARNDSTSTGSGAFGGPCTEGTPAGQICPPPGENIGGITNSIPRVGGVAAYAYSTDLAAAMAHTPVSSGLKTFCNPLLLNNVIWQNRTFYWDAAYCGNVGGLRPDVRGQCGAIEAPVFWDLAVYDTAMPTLLSPQNTDLSDDPQNHHDYSGHGDLFADPSFVRSYYNLYQATSKGASFGNFVTATFAPNGLMSGLDLLFGDYHLRAGSPVIGHGATLPPANSPFIAAPTRNNPFQNALDQLVNSMSGAQTEALANVSIFKQWPELAVDYDNQKRPAGSRVDMGADEQYPTEKWFPW